jgi:hypothetical protein
MRSDLGFVWVSRARIRKKRLYTYPHSLQYRMAIAAVEMPIIVNQMQQAEILVRSIQRVACVCLSSRLVRVSNLALARPCPNLHPPSTLCALPLPLPLPPTAVLCDPSSEFSWPWP